YIAASGAACQGVWLARLLRSLLGLEVGVPVLKIDNKSAIDLCKNPRVRVCAPAALVGDCRSAADRELPPARAAMKRMLLAAIHRSYLKALGSLPQRELTDRLHRSVLHGDSCYGPLDPVSNIIVNTVWYDQNFLASKQVKLDMISTQCLWRAAARSLYGLVSFLCTRYQNLTPDQALQRLMGAPSVTVPEAYAAAATAAHHPNLLAQKEFLGSSDTVANLKVASKVLHLQDGRLLSSKDLEFLCMLISSKCPFTTGMSHKQPEPEPTKVNIVLYTHVSECCRMFRGQQERARRIMAAALSKLNETAEPHYRLHVICGVNELVSGPEFSLDVSGGYNPWTPHIYLHSHMNFLTTREGEHASNALLC
uniref:Uncharacterized protein n=1 Tax=Setaria italica TaxID=4555 RepID=K3Y3C1_SETIT